MEPEKRSSHARRVIKKGPRYICGMCGKPHLFRKLAETCLEKCLASESKGDSISEKSKDAKKKFRCTYCKRVYNDVEKARECVRLCRKRVAEKQEVEKKFSLEPSMQTDLKARQLAELAQHMSQTGAQDSSIGSGIAKKGKSFVCLTCKSIFASQDLALNCRKRHQASSSGSYLERIKKAQERLSEKIKSDHESMASRVRQATPQKPVATAAPKKEGLGSDDQKMFQQKGSSFFCQKCKSRYNSRNEVIACYKKHAQDERGQTTLKGTANEPKEHSSTRPETHKFKRDGAKYICQKCNASYLHQQDVVRCFDKHERAMEEALSEAVESSESKKRRRHIAANVPDKEKFMRNGAKYVCKYCGEKYYTKLEVIQCFDGHQNPEE